MPSPTPAKAIVEEQPAGAAPPPGTEKGLRPVEAGTPKRVDLITVEFLDRSSPREVIEVLAR